jgi:hypothetical protein
MERGPLRARRQYLVQSRIISARAFSRKSETDFGSKMLWIKELERFLTQNRHPPRIKSGASILLKALSGA